MEGMPVRARFNLSERFASFQRLWLAAFAGRRKAATLAAAALTLGVGYHVVFGANGLTVYIRKRAETRVLKQQTVELDRENNELQEHVDRLKSDPDAIEHQAREDLHYAKPGEVIYTMPDNNATMPSSDATSSGNNSTEPDNNDATSAK